MNLQENPSKNGWNARNWSLEDIIAMNSYDKVVDSDALGLALY